MDCKPKYIKSLKVHDKSLKALVGLNISKIAQTLRRIALLIRSIRISNQLLADDGYLGNVSSTAYSDMEQNSKRL